MDAFSTASFAGWQLTALGAWFGLVHACDADHLATLAGLAANDRKRSATHYALRWALGHAAALGAAGLAVLAAGYGGLAGIGGWAEAAVALVLLALATQSFGAVAREALGGAHRVAPLERAAPGTAAPLRSSGSYRNGWLLGLLHGGAGSAAVLALLPLGALDGVASAFLYLACFSAGVAAGALAFAHGVARVLAACRAPTRRPTLALAVQAAAGSAAALAGVWLLRDLPAAVRCVGGC